MSGGGKSQTTTVDPVYNAGLLEIAKEDQDFKRTFMNMFQYGTSYDPTEKVTGYYDDNGKFVEASPTDTRNPDYVPAEYKTVPDRSSGGAGGWDAQNHAEKQELVSPAKGDPYIKSTAPNGAKFVTISRGEAMGYDPKAQTSEMQYLQNTVNANQSLLGMQTEVSKKELALAGEKADLGSTLINDINKGIDVGERMDEAQADVQHGFKIANESARKDISSYGLDPSSGRYASTNRGIALAEAEGIAGARTTAKNIAEDEDFKRKIAGIQYIG